MAPCDLRQPTRTGSARKSRNAHTRRKADRTQPQPFASPAPRAARTKDARYEVLASYQPLAYACTLATRNSTSTSSRRISSHSVLFSHSALLILDSGTFAKSRTLLPVLSLVPLCICSCSVQDLLQVAGIAPPAPTLSQRHCRKTNPEYPFSAAHHHNASICHFLPVTTNEGTTFGIFIPLRCSIVGRAYHRSHVVASTLSRHCQLRRFSLACSPRDE